MSQELLERPQMNIDESVTGPSLELKLAIMAGTIGIAVLADSSSSFAQCLSPNPDGTCPDWAYVPDAPAPTTPPKSGGGGGGNGGGGGGGGNPGGSGGGSGGSGNGTPNLPAQPSYSFNADYKKQGCAPGAGRPDWVSGLNNQLDAANQIDPTKRMAKIITDCPTNVMIDLINKPAAEVTHTPAQVFGLTVFINAENTPATAEPAPPATDAAPVASVDTTPTPAVVVPPTDAAPAPTVAATPAPTPVPTDAASPSTASPNTAAPTTTKPAKTVTTSAPAPTTIVNTEAGPAPTTGDTVAIAGVVPKGGKSGGFGDALTSPMGFTLEGITALAVIGAAAWKRIRRIHRAADLAKLNSPTIA